MNNGAQKISSVFCDLDGTLANSLPAMYDAYVDFLKQFDVIGCAEEFEKLNGPSLNEIVDTLKQRYCLEQELDALYQNYKEKIIQVYESNVKPMKGAQALLDQLKEQGIRLSLVTSSPRSIADVFLQRQNWNQYFENVTFGDEVKQAKPHPQIYQLALKKDQASAEKVLVVEDSVNGVLSAKEAGCVVAGFTSHQSEKVLCDAGADLIVNDLESLPRMIIDEKL